jgi:hypothetical protein
MPWVDSLDWTSLNALRRYPIREGLSATSNDGYFTIPDNLIVDFTLSATSNVARRFFISKIFNRLNELTVEISDDLDRIVGTFEIDGNSHITDKSYYMNVTNNYVGSNGKIEIGSLEGLLGQPAGSFSFLLGATELEPRTIIPGISGVDRIKFIDTLEGEYSMSGDVVLATRRNNKFSYEISTNTVIFDAGDDLGLNKACAEANCIKTVNGVAPNNNGNINLLGTDCLKISSPMQYTLEMEDTCCTPCSGCSDLEELTTRLASLENKFLDLKSNYANINSQLNTYLATVNSNCACP